MATDLHDRLSDLAAHAPAAAPPRDLWDRGVRRHRAAVAGRVALAAVLVALIGLGGWTWQSATPVEPADTHGSPHLPDRFYFQPSPWTRPFDGPPGSLVAVVPTEQATVLHSSAGLVGVTASSGTYGFLRLPDNAALSPTLSCAFALSPDGRRLAFWTTGAPSGAANTQMEDGLTITGVATYDTVTGQVHASRVATEHGLDPGLLIWSDDMTLLFGYSQIVGPDNTENETTSQYGATEAWRPGSSEPVALALGKHHIHPDNFDTRATRGLVVSAGANGRSWWVLDPRRQELRAFRTDRAADVLVPDLSHTRVVGVPGLNTGGGPLVVADIPPASGHGSEARFRTVAGGHGWVRPLAWVDEDHVAALHRIVVDAGDGSRYVSGRIDLVDVRTGASRPLVAEWGQHGTNDSDPWLATQLLGAPVAHATPPPSPPDLRAWTIGLVVAGGLVLLIGVPLVRGTRGRRA